MTDGEMLKLRKELLHARETIEDLQEELRLTDEKYLQMQEEFNRNQDVVRQARDDLAKIEGLVEQRVNERVAQEIKNKENLEELLREKNELIERLKDEQDKLLGREKMLTKDYEYLRNKMEETMGGNFEMQDALREVKKTKEEREKKEKEIERLVTQLNDLSKQTEDLIAENRVLREMAGTPENFGIQINEIKLAEKEKIEEYKIKLRYYEEEIHALERERATLRARLRERPTIPGKEEFTRGLTPEQILQIEDFVLALRDGKTPTMADEDLRKENERLRAELQKGRGSTDVEKIVERALMKRSGVRGGEQPDSSGILEKIQQENAELLKSIREVMFNAPQSAGQIVETVGRHRSGLLGDEAGAKKLSRYLYPPEPIKRPDGTVVEGVSYRFPGAPLPIVPFDMGRYTADRIEKHEFAFMQLALVECIELNARKDGELKSYTGEFQNIEGKLRGYLLQRNELYKEYTKQFSSWKEEGKAMRDQNSELTELLRAEKIKNGDLEKLLATLQSGIRDSEVKEKLIELTKRSSILEVTMMQLTRKYLTLQEEYKLMHTQYMSVDKENKDRELLLEERISRLKDWKSKAVLELKYLYKKLRESVSLIRYDRLQREIESLREKDRLWLQATQDLMSIRSERVSIERARAENEEARKEAEATLTDSEQELQQLAGRLKRKDPQYAYERAVLDRIIDAFRTYKLSPQEAFEIFDKNHDGSISREEFRNVLSQLRLDLSYSDVEAIMKYLDVDATGSIRYKSFIRTLKRYGIKTKSKEEETIARVADIINRSGVDIKKAFEVIDRDGDNMVNRQEMLDALLSMRLGIREEELSNAINSIYPEGASGIDYRRFCRVFEKSLQAAEKEEKKVRDSWKMDILRKIDEKLMAQRLALHSAFELTKEGNVTKQELGKLCARLEIPLSPQELTDLYADFDTKGNGTASFDDIAVGIISAKAAGRTGGLKSGGLDPGRSHVRESAADEVRRGLDEGDVESLKTRVLILQEREKLALDKAKREYDQVKSLQETIKKRNEECEQLEKRMRQLTDKHFTLQEIAVKNESQLANCVSKDEAKELERKFEVMEHELLDKDAALHTYKGMYEAIIQQMRALELSFARKKDEVNELHKALLEVQSGNDKDNLIGKLYYVVLLSRWQEGATNRKYDSVISEVKRLKTNLYSCETDVARKEEDVSGLEARLQDSAEALSKLQEKARNYEDLEYNREKVRELAAKLGEATQAKIDIEMSNIKLREENTRLAYMTDQLELEKKQAQDLSDMLKSKNDSELARKIIELSDSISALKLSELRAQRDSKMSKEKEIYLDRVNSQNNMQIKKLEEELASAMASLHKVEEAFREKDKERERLFFELKQMKRSEKPAEVFGKSHRPADELSELRSAAAKAKASETAPQQDITGLASPTTPQQIKEYEDTIWKLRKELEKAQSIIPSGSAPERSKLDIEIQKDEEKRQMATVAYNTIKTLEGIINNQRDQIKRKDEMIKQVRDEGAKERDESLKQIAKLQQELAGEGQSAMGRMISYGKGGQGYRGAIPGVYNEGNILEVTEVDTTLQKKDGRIKELAGKVDLYNKEVKKRDDEIRGLKNLNFELQEKLDRFGREEKLSVTRLELDKTKKELAKRNNEYKSLKSAIEKLKQDFDTYNEKSAKQEAEINVYATKERQYDSDKNQLEQQLRNAQKELKQQTKVVQKAEERLQTIATKEQEFKEELASKNKELEAERAQKAALLRELDIEKSKNSLVLRKSGAEDRKREEPIIPSLQPRSPSSSVPAETKKELDRLRQDLLLYKQKAEGVSESEAELTVNPEKCTIEAKSSKTVAVGLCYVDEIMEAACEAVHPKVRPLEILRAYAENENTISEMQFILACSKIGITLDELASAVMVSRLKRSEAGVEYVEFAAALKGNLFPRLIDEELYQLGEHVAGMNLSHRELTRRFVSEAQEDGLVRKEAIEQGIAQLSKTDTRKEAEYALKRVRTGSDENVYNAHKLVKLIEKGQRTFLAESIRKAARETSTNMGSLFAMLDRNNDSKLEKPEFEKLLEELGLRSFSGPNLDCALELFDPKHTGKVDFSAYSDLLVLSSEQCEGMRMAEAKKFKHDLSVICRRTAKVIVNSVGGQLLEQFAELDADETGLVSQTEALTTIQRLPVKDLKRADLLMLLQELDSRNIGHYCYHALVRKLADYSQDSKPDAVMRRIISICIRKGAPMNNAGGFRQAVGGMDKEGKVSGARFRSQIQSLIPGMSEDELNGLEGAFRGRDGRVDMKTFTEELFSPELRKPAPASSSAGLTTLSEYGKKGRKDVKEQMEKTSMAGQALRGKLEELKKETETLKKENNVLNQRIAVLERSKPELGIRPMEFKEKTKAGTLSKKDEYNLAQYSAKIAELEGKNYELLKKIDTEYKPQIGKQRTDIEKLKVDIKFLKLDNLKLESQVEKMLKKPMDGTEKRNELEYLKDMKIKEQEKKIDELLQEVKKLEERTFALEQSKLELQFEKENFDLERSRLERRIKDLEEFQAVPR